MSNLYWFSEAQIERLKPFLPKSHCKPCMDDRHVLSGIIFINHNGLRRCDAPKEYGPAKTPTTVGSAGATTESLLMVGLATERAEHKKIMIDATYLKVHRTASSLRVKKGPVSSPWRKSPRG